ncbi:MAG TPA: RHS repeat-associated core domain-containing protein, partial [Phototrophicaceae bacterium]|nr:RHS repeat-associated core domain-containing protein [Phototrophicaceae bacterium]
MSATVTQYLLDLQPGLATVLQATQGANTTSYVHAPRGIHGQKDASGNWEWMLQDGLGSVRSVVDSSLNPLESRLYEPYGVPFGTSGTSQTSYGFTGEMTDANNLLYLRARYYAPSLGVFTAQDYVESVNRYL